MSGEIQNVVLGGSQQGGAAPRPPGFSQPAYHQPAQSSAVNLDFYTPDTSDFSMDQMSGAIPSVSPMTRSETMNTMSTVTYDDEDYENEPPLLEELDINFEHILGKTKAVLQPFKKVDTEVLSDSDMTGPFFFCMCLAFSLLLQGKVHFGYIYGYGVFGCISLYVLLNLLSPIGHAKIDIWTIVSTVGYCLLPVVLVAALGIVMSLTGMLGNIIAFVAVLWCTYTATRQFERILGMEKQRYLMAYPIGLLYSCFVLIAMF